MSVKWNSEWRPPPYWIYFRCQFWSPDLFPVIAVNIPTSFCEFTSIGGWVIAFCGKIKYGRRRRFGFVETQIWRCVSLRVAIFSLCAKFCANTCNSDRVMSIKRKWRPPPSSIYFRCRFWSHALFPVAAIYIPTKFRNCISTCGWVNAFCGSFGNSGPPTNLLTDLKSHSKLGANRTYTFQDIVILKFWKFGLKRLFWLKKFTFWGFNP